MHELPINVPPVTSSMIIRLAIFTTVPPVEFVVRVTPATVVVVIGGSFSLDCSVTLSGGVPEDVAGDALFQWYRRDDEKSAAEMLSTESGLRVKGVGRDDAGVYVCSVTVESVTETGNATVIVRGQ